MKPFKEKKEKKDYYKSGEAIMDNPSAKDIRNQTLSKVEKKYKEKLFIKKITITDFTKIQYLSRRIDIIDENNKKYRFWFSQDTKMIIKFKEVKKKDEPTKDEIINLSKFKGKPILFSDDLKKVQRYFKEQK